MKKISMAMLAMLAMLAMGSSAMAQDNSSNISGTIDIPYLSEFNSRGRTFQDTEVLQPNATLTKTGDSGSFFVNTWGNLDPDNYSHEGEATFNEIDITVGLQKANDVISYGMGLIEYVYSGTDIPNTHEVYGTVTYLSWLNPNLWVCYDFKEADGWYGIASVNHTFKLVPDWALTIDTGLGYGTEDYNDLYFGVKDDAVNDWNSGLTLAVNMTKNTVLSAGVRYVDLIDDDIENGAMEFYGVGDETITKIALTITL